MAHAVFTTSVGSSYDDLREYRYHFPRTYLKQVQAAVGDWIVYYEPRRSHRGGRQACFAMARVLRIEADSNLQDHHYPCLDGYLEFDHPVGFQGPGSYWESALQKADGSTNKGAFGRAVRPLPVTEFEAIVRAGYHRRLEPWEIKDAALAQGVAEDVVAYDKAQGTHRQILERVDPIPRDFVADLEAGDRVELDFRTNHPEAATLRIHKDGSILCPLNPPGITGELVARLRDRGAPVRYCQPTACPPAPGCLKVRARPGRRAPLWTSPRRGAFLVGRGWFCVFGFDVGECRPHAALAGSAGGLAGDGG